MSSIKKTSVVHEKTMTPRSCIRWKPTGKIIKTIGLRWVPTRKIFTSSTTKVDSEPTNGLNDDITNQYECKQTLDVSAVQQSTSPTPDKSAPQTHTLNNIQPTLELTTPTNVHAEENNDNQAEFTNPFCTPVQENAESSSCNIGNSNVHTFNQPQDSEYQWTKDHPLTQVRGNPSKPVQTRRQLATDPEMCMFALTVSIVEPKNIKEAMADSAWIEAMQEELHQFNRLQVWELVDKPFGKNEEGIDFEESFAPVAPDIGAFRIFVAYAAHKVYVASNPDGFFDPDPTSNKVYRLGKLYKD
ncbi:hypothetical protein Tco_0965872 [Tanacetum coccineum]